MTTLIDTLGLTLKRELKNPVYIGKMIHDAKFSNVPTIDKLEMAKITKRTYAREFEWALNEGCKVFKDTFYIDIYYKKDPVHKEVDRIVTDVRATCPYPIYNRTAYMVNPKTGDYTKLWHIPQKVFCNSPHLLALGHEGNEDLLNSIKDFKTGVYRRLFDELVVGEMKYE